MTKPKPYVGPFARVAQPGPKPQPKTLAGPGNDPASEPGPDTAGTRRARYNLTVRLSADERERLKAIGHQEGKPHPMTLAETVRFLIDHWPG